MTRRITILALLGVLVALALAVPQLTGAFPSTRPVADPPPPARTNPYSDAWLAANHGKFDNTWTAEYETRLQSKAAQPGGPLSALMQALNPLYGVDVRMSNGSVLSGNQNEFQIAINPANSQFAIGTSNDGGTAGVGIFRTTNGGTTWTSADASAYGVPPSCCDPGVDYAGNGSAVYAVILSTASGGLTYIIKSTDNGATWPQRTQVSTPDRENIAIDPNNPNIVYVTYSDLPATNRIKGYKSTDGGLTWGASFFVGAAAPPAGYEQSSMPRVASNGWLYVGYQQYTNSGTGCSAGVQNVLARSTDGGVTFNHTVLPITQGGACSGAQAGRGIFCINAAGTSSFRSRSHPIIGVSPTNPLHVYMVYSGGDLETAYTCQSSPGFHSDTLFRLSTDGGVTFSAASKVNDDVAGKDQYYPWMGVKENGQIWVGWNDRREDPNNVLSRWYQAYSNDEGATWRKVDGTVGNDPVADVQTQPSTFIGDYHGLDAKSNNVLGMWYDSRNTASGDAYTDPQVPPIQGTPTPTVTGTPPTATRTSTVTSTAVASNTPTPSPTACAVSSYVSTDVPRTICDLCTITSTLTIPAGAGTIADLDLTGLNATHTWISDMIVSLTSPSNTTVVLINRICGSEDNFTNITLDDSAAAPIGSSCPPTPNGSFIPANALAAFAGQAASGTWILTISDNAAADTGNLTAWGLRVSRSGGCGTATPTSTPGTPSTATATRTNTPGPTNTAPPTSAASPTTTAPPTTQATSTATATTAPTTCPVQFQDVAVGSTFYEFIRCLACRGIVSGYPCGGPSEPCPGNYFRPGNNVTRGQVSKIVSESAGFNNAIPSTQWTFQDVPPSGTFWLWVERLTGRGIIGGYPCGGALEPCVAPGNRPYFRPNNDVTRGQLSKMVAGAAGWTETPTGQTFEDVAPGSTFYVYVERVASRGIVAGYPCGGVGEPCVGPGNKPYFRPNNNATRGQMSKIAASAFFPGCSTPARR